MTAAVPGDVSTGPTPIAGSFRDPSGFLYERDGVLLRQVDRSFADTYDRVVASGLYDALIRDGLLVAHEEVDLDLAADPERAHRVLRPERLPFVSYPYEWVPAQRRAAALLTLRIQDVALAHGMTLRDASAYNVQFHRGRPVFIDTLSFEPDVDDRMWVAYRQFCQHFLAPLALETLVDVRLSRLLVADVDGVPIDLAAGLLPGRTKLRPGLLTHLHGQARSAAKAAESQATAAGSTRSAGQQRGARFSQTAKRGLVEGLRGTVERLTWDPGRTTWSDYYAEASHYSEAAMAAKVAAVDGWLDRLEPGMVWDLGANTGRFSRLAADRGADVVAFDVDPGAVQAAWSDLAGMDLPGSVLPLVLDLATPSPAIGWAHEERRSLADRGPADLVLALALVHHLAIGNNVPLPRVAAYLARLARHLVVEWVPKDDPKVATLLATREDVFDDYTEAGFRAAFGACFETVDEVALPDSGRVLHLLRARDDHAAGRS